MIDYLNELREGCLEAYTGVVQGLKGDDSTNRERYTFTPSHCHTHTRTHTHTPTADVKLVWPQVPYMIQLIEFIAKDDDRTDGTIACSAGLLG